MSDELPALSPLGHAALAYVAEHGWPIFPVRPRGKKPLLEGAGYKDASVDAEQIGKWWDEYPDANIGFSPGAKNFLVFDIDGDAGEATARELGLLETATLEVITGRGRHLYFDLPKHTPEIGNLSTWDERGINVRAHKGYVLLPPSVHASGHVYRWRECPE